MTKRSEERIQFLSDIITTAIEGGIGYWSACSQYQYDWDGETRRSVGELVEGERTRATVQELDDSSGEYTGTVHEITIDTIARGIGKIRDNEFGINSQIRKWITEGDRENDAGMIDADAADCIVQAGLFGELVYG